MLEHVIPPLFLLVVGTLLSFMIVVALASSSPMTKLRYHEAPRLLRIGRWLKWKPLALLRGTGMVLLWALAEMPRLAPPRSPSLWAAFWEPYRLSWTWADFKMGNYVTMTEFFQGLRTEELPLVQSGQSCGKSRTVVWQLRSAVRSEELFNLEIPSWEERQAIQVGDQVRVEVIFQDQPRSLLAKVIEVRPIGRHVVYYRGRTSDIPAAFQQFWFMPQHIYAIYRE